MATYVVEYQRQTFGEETCGVIRQVSAEIPPIPKLVILFDQLNAIAFGQCQLIGAPCYEIMDTDENRAGQYPSFEIPTRVAIAATNVSTAQIVRMSCLDMANTGC